jgi:hypothetical protein
VCSLVKTIIGVALFVNLVACSISSTLPMDPGAAATGKSAYVYGRFKLESHTDAWCSFNGKTAGDVILFLKKPGTEDDGYRIKFDKKNDIFVISVKPGTYEWGKLYFAKGPHVVSTRLLSESGSAVVITFQPGKAYYIGDYTGKTSASFSPGQCAYTWDLDKFSANYAETTRELIKKYTRLSQIEMIDDVPQLGVSKSLLNRHP